MSIRAAIFDLDGTLLDSMHIWDELGIAYLHKRGIAARPDLPDQLATLSMQQTAQYLIAQYGLIDSEQKIMDDINFMVTDFYLNHVQLKPGAQQLLHAFAQRGVAMCIATATDRPLVQGALRRLNLLAYFTRIFTCTEVGAGKDRPDIYLAALNYLGTTKAETLVFEDALHAIETAKSAGMRVVAVHDNSMAQHKARIAALSEIYLNSYAEWRDDLD